MDQINALYNHPKYQEALRDIQEAEKDRVFCGHDFQHFLDVARIGYIYVLEEGLAYSKEVIYAFALLHDIGRAEEYRTGEDHHLLSGRMAEAILSDLNFSSGDKSLILEAIDKHRGHGQEGLDSFSALMKKADKASRACYRCPAQKDCYWDINKKNMKIEV